MRDEVAVGSAICVDRLENFMQRHVDVPLGRACGGIAMVIHQHGFLSSLGCLISP